MTSGIDVNAESLDRTAGVLREVAADLRVGQFDLFLLDWAAAPRCHADMAAAMREFAEFAHDQYRDTVALVAWLALLLQSAAESYRQKDAAVAHRVAQPSPPVTPWPALP